MKRLGIGLACAAALGAAAATVALGGIIACTGGPCTGTEGDDGIEGSPLADQIYALGGNDFVDAAGGNDLVRAGEGSDGSLGGPGKDVMKDGEGADSSAAGAGADKIIAGKGNDRILDLPLRGLRQRGGTESCLRGFCSGSYGDEGNDLIRGGRGKDYMEGEEGRDRMFGGRGNDVIDAANDDTPGAKDEVRCGRGRDLVFANRADEVADDCEKVKGPRPEEEL